jgi:hypothetical protein
MSLISQPRTDCKCPVGVLDILKYRKLIEEERSDLITKQHGPLGCGKLFSHLEFIFIKLMLHSF